jgi:2-desacetyl-2-hydroxyethyl bacteriochlorophyllide A dehydrogenase
MKAWQLVGHRCFEFVDVEMPPLDDGQVLVRVEYASVCGSDTHVNYEPLLPEERYPLAPGSPCHEVVGTVVESRNSAFEVGSRAIVLPENNPARGYTSGGLAEYIASAKVIGIPSEGDSAEWLMCQPMGTVLYAAHEWGNATEKRIAVLGQGAIGLAFTMLAARQGALDVIAIDPLDYRIDKAVAVGATAGINPATTLVPEAILEATNGAGVDVVVDATGDPAGLNLAVDAINRFGTIISFSLIGPGAVVEFNHATWMRKQARLIPTVSASTPNPTREIAEIVRLRQRGWIEPASLITHRWKWDRVPEAYEMYANHEDGVVKVVLEVG